MKEKEQKNTEGRKERRKGEREEEEEGKKEGRKEDWINIKRICHSLVFQCRNNSMEVLQI